MESNQTIYYESPLGTLKITGDEEGISSIVFSEEPAETSLKSPKYFLNCISQLNEYFNGARKKFNVKLNPSGTEFQKNVWDTIDTVPFGKTKSYLEQSKLLGNTKAIRAVATANAKNPIMIIIPCHRIIGSDGSLTGYAGGIGRKQWLLEHESGIRQQSLF